MIYYIKLFLTIINKKVLKIKFLYYFNTNKNYLKWSFRDRPKGLSLN